METLLSRDLKEFGVTTRQWFLSATINSLFESPPTIKAVAKEMGSCHQNIKQVALKLQDKGLLKLEKDKNDARVTRLRMTEESYVFWKETVPKGELFIENVFKDIEEQDLIVARTVLQKILSNLTEMNDAVIDVTED